MRQTNRSTKPIKRHTYLDCSFSKLYTFLAFTFVPVINTFFSQDDFFHFQVSKTYGSLIVGYIMFNFYQQLNQRRFFAKSLLSLFILSLFTLSATSALLGSTNYWAATRGKLAEKLINQVKTTYPILPRGAIVYFKNDPTYPYLTKEWGGSSKQASTILNGSDALQLLYKDPTLQVYYEDIKKPTSSENLYSIMAKIY